ncbi:MAG: hypothetical protein FWD87_04020 [Spirochaetaceae bacterium]|nr:hypothetical protein [Spirochaetaceae bacterium]
MVLDYLVFRAERAAEELLQFGRYCLWLKAEVGYGNFYKALERRNIIPQSADWAMLICEKFGTNVTTLRHLAKPQALGVLELKGKSDSAVGFGQTLKKVHLQKGKNSGLGKLLLRQ